MDVAIVSGCFTLAGVVLGWWLSSLVARKAAREEREWVEHKTVRDRQAEAAAAFDQALVDISQEMPGQLGPGDDVRRQLASIHGRVREAWARASVLSEPEIASRER